MENFLKVINRDKIRNVYMDSDKFNILMYNTVYGNYESSGRVDDSGKSMNFSRPIPPTISEKTTFDDIVFITNKMFITSYNTEYTYITNVFKELPSKILESIILKYYNTFSIYIHSILIRAIYNDIFIKKILEFENEKSVHLSLNFIDINSELCKDLVQKISKFENTKLMNKTLSKKYITRMFKRVLKKLNNDEVDVFYNSCSKNFIESISSNLYFASILPTSVVKIKIPSVIKSDNNINLNYNISIDESKLYIQNIFDEKLKIFFQSFTNIKEILIFIKTYPFLKIDKEKFKDSSIEDYIELLGYINNA